MMNARPARLFLDANVLISASWKEESKVARIWRIPEVDLITSGYVIDECVRNLPVPIQQERFRRLLERVRVVEFPSSPTLLNAPIDLPAKDQPVLAAAVLARAHFLVTGDLRHFGTWFGKTILGVRIEPPGSFPQILETGVHHPGY